MAIGVKVDPTLIVSGKVVFVAERYEFLNDTDKAAGKVARLERHDVLVIQDTGAQIAVRHRLDRSGALMVPVPLVGDFYAVEARVSEGSFRDAEGREREYVNLVAVRPADNALDVILTAFNNAQSKKAA